MRHQPSSETAEAIYLTSGCVTPAAEEAEAAFKGGDRNASLLFAVRQPDCRDVPRVRLALLRRRGGGARLGPGWPQCSAALGGNAVPATGSSPAGALRRATICAQVLPRWSVEADFVDGSDLNALARGALGAGQEGFRSGPQRSDDTVGRRARSRRVRNRDAHAAGAQSLSTMSSGFLVFSPLATARMPRYSATKHRRPRALPGWRSAFSSAQFV